MTSHRPYCLPRNIRENIEIGVEMDLEYPKFDIERSEFLEPDSERIGDIFTRLGYKLPDAIADLVDNSADANAGTVLVRFVRSNQAIQRVVIADDGQGRDES